MKILSQEEIEKNIGSKNTTSIKPEIGKPYFVAIGTQIITSTGLKTRLPWSVNTMGVFYVGEVWLKEVPPHSVSPIIFKLVEN